MTRLTLITLMLCHAVMADLYATDILGKDAIQEHGSLTFDPNQFQETNGEFRLIENESSAKKLWTGWWFPSRDRDMFDMPGTVSPLEAYDEMYRVIRHYQRGMQRYRNPVLSPLYQKWSTEEAKEYFDLMDEGAQFDSRIAGAASYEEYYVHSSNGTSWDGVCEGVAFAALLEEEPVTCKKFTSLDGQEIILTPFHQKALLAKKYDFVEKGVIYYGNAFVNEPWNSNIGGPQHDYSDISPEQMHRLMHYYMRDRKQAFIMDYDADYPIWNVAVYNYHSAITDNRNGTLTVHTYLYYSNPFVEREKLIGEPGNYVLHASGLQEEYIQVAYEFDYVVQNGKYVVTGSRWTENESLGVESFKYHPDYIIALDKDKVVPRSAADVVNPSIVDFMLKDLEIVPCPGD